MPKRKKYPKLPNGYGSIKYLGRGRRNPYAVHPPVTEFTLDGVPITPKALCYVDDWMIGFAVLTAYKAGTYTPGMEKAIPKSDSSSIAGNALVQRILADYNLTKAADEKLDERKTFAQVYDEFYKWKYENETGRKLSASSRKSTRAAFRNCSAIHDKVFADLRHHDLQNIIDSCPLKHSSKELIVSLFHQLYSYAEIYELIEKDYSAHVRINEEDDDEHGVPFSDADLKKLWMHKDDPIVGFILIMCYSGYRIAAYQSLEVNLAEMYFKGGIKTEAGKERIVPIHSAILPLVRCKIEKYGKLLPCSISAFRNKMRKAMAELEIDDHTPHDCRHTFSALCEKYKVNENDRKRMLGHSFGSDITNGTYGHRSVEELRTEIEKIRICY